VGNLLDSFCVFVPKICLVGGQRSSRRGRAAASLPSGLVHRLSRLSPRLSLRSPSSVRAGLRSALPAVWLPAPVRPVGAPSLPPGRAGRPLRGDRPAPPAFGTAPLPGPGRLRLPVLGRCGRLRDRINPRTLRSAASVWCFGPSADRRCALTALALRFFRPLPAPGATSLRSDAPVRGLMRSRLRARMKTRTLHSPAPWWPAWLPVTSFVGDRQPRAIIFTSVVGGSIKAIIDRTRHVSPVRALALETAARIPGRRTVPPCGLDRPCGR